MTIKVSCRCCTRIVYVLAGTNIDRYTGHNGNAYARHSVDYYAVVSTEALPFGGMLGGSRQKRQLVAEVDTNDCLFVLIKAAADTI